MRFLGLDLPVFIAHRGASALAPENTLASYRLAIEAGMELAECDLRRTRDGRIVVMHDARVNRTTDGTGRVAELTLEQIKSLDAGSWFAERFRGERVPTFEQYLDQVQGRVRPVIELKEQGLAAEVVAALRERGLVEQTVIVSFLPDELAAVHQLEPALATGWLFGDGRPVEVELETATRLGARMAGPWEGLVTADLVRQAHDRDLVVQAWTVDDRARMAELLGLGVDIIATNKPLTPQERQRLKG